MASIRIKFRPSTVKDKEGTLFFQVIHMRRTKQLYTGVHISEEEWNSAETGIRIPAGCSEQRAAYLISAQNRLHEDLNRLKNIITGLEKSGREFTPEDVASGFTKPAAVTGILSFTENLIIELRRIGKTKTARRFAVTLSSLSSYVSGQEITWNEFTSTLLSGYEEHLLGKGLCRNTTSYYMRNLRSIANRAAEQDYELPRNPFRHVYMGVDKTAKRAISLKCVRKIRDLDLSDSPPLEYARDMFMFAFYTRGMSFVDIAFLRKTDLRDDVITYRRRKTRQLITVRVEAPTKAIMKRLGTSGSSYLLPVITDDTDDADRQYQNAYHRVNRNLRIIGERLGLEPRLTMYVARHAWASIARNSNVPLATISEAMGHDSETTTRIYLSTIDTSSVDKANSKILKMMDSE